MIKKVFIHLQTDDLVWMIQHKFQELQDAENLCFCPHVCDYGIKAGVKNLAYVESSLLVGQESVNLDRESRDFSWRVDRKLSRVRQSIFNVKNATGWDTLPLKMLYQRMSWFRLLGDYVKNKLPKDKEYLIVSSRGAQLFEFDSGMPAHVLYQSMNKDGFVVGLYDIGFVAGMDKYQNFSALIPDLGFIQKNLNKSETLVHIPTCFHDKNFFRKWINKNYPNSLDIASPLWDVGLREDKSNRANITYLPPDHQLRKNKLALEYEMAFKNVLIEEFRDQLGDQLLFDQVRYWSLLANTKAVFYDFLKNALVKQKIKPKYLVTSNHDGGLSGPLFSIANEFDLNIVVLPHSLTQNIAIPTSKKITAYSDVAYQYAAMDTDDNLIQTNYLNIRNVSSLKNLKKKNIVKNILIIHSMFSNRGIQLDSLMEFKNFYAKLKELSDKANVNLTIRLKPVEAPFHLCAQQLGLSLESLVIATKENVSDQILKNDLVIFWAAPSSAAQICLINQVPSVTLVGSPKGRKWADNEKRVLPDCLNSVDYKKFLDNFSKIIEGDSDIISEAVNSLNTYQSRILELH